MNVSVKYLFRLLATTILLAISGNTLSSQHFYPRFNPRPYAGISIIPGYATAWLAERDFFLSGGLSGGLIYEFPRLICFAKYEYLVDLTGYSHNQTAIQDAERYYLNRYYVSIGLKVRLQED